MTTLLQSLPKVDEILKDPLFLHCSKTVLKPIIQENIQILREKIFSKQCQAIDLDSLKQNILSSYQTKTSSTIQTLINATGVVLQTNLGRSLLSQEILEEILPFLQNYNNLEYDIQEGKRSERYTHIHHLLQTLLGCEDAIVVNNNASAVLLVLNTFGKGNEVVISRGELVEIGGAFRIPEVMKLSGSTLIEVGTTNKTHLQDYQEALTPQTTILMKAHQSNFKQVGFCQSVPFHQLTQLAQKHNLIDYYDLGSGYMQGLDIKEEPNLFELCASQPSLLSFSGDKLFGGPQAGIIVGKKTLIDKLKKNHLLRALRVDKFTILALEATLRAYLQNTLEKIPTLAFLNLKPEQIHAKAKTLLSALSHLQIFHFQIKPVNSLAGGGSLPQTPFPSYAILLQSPNLKTSTLERKLRQRAIIARIQEDWVCLDLRCIFQTDFPKITQALEQIQQEIKNAK